MKKTLIIFLFSNIVNISFAQEIIVHYDFLTEKVDIIKAHSKDTLHSKVIKVQPGTSINFKIKNYNQEATYLEKHFQKTTKIDSISFNKNQNAILGFLQNKYVAPILGSEFKSIIETFGSGRGQKFKPTGSSKLSINLDELNSIELYNVQELNVLLNSRFEAVSKIFQTNLNLKDLRYSNRLGESELKRKSDEYLAIFDNETRALIKNKEKQIDTFSKFKEIAGQNSMMLEFATNALKTQITKESETQNRGEKQYMPYLILQKNLGAVQLAMTEINENMVFKKLEEIYSDYQAIQNKNYNYTFNSTVDFNNDLLNLNFYKVNLKDSVISKGELINSTAFQFKLKEVKIETSAGLLFSSYFDPKREYGIVNNTVVSSISDKITPVLATLLNISSSGSGLVKLGGHFGIGVGMNDEKNVHFVIGPTISIGRNDIIKFHGGISTSKIKRLGNGLKEGDTISGEIPTINRYELSGFFGLSVNISSIQK